MNSEVFYIAAGKYKTVGKVSRCGFEFPLTNSHPFVFRTGKNFPGFIWLMQKKSKFHVILKTFREAKWTHSVTSMTRDSFSWTEKRIGKLEKVDKNCLQIGKKLKKKKVEDF